MCRRKSNRLNVGSYVVRTYGLPVDRRADGWLCFGATRELSGRRGKARIIVVRARGHPNHRKKINRFASDFLSPISIIVEVITFVATID
jgi:hypothetical protein